MRPHARAGAVGDMRFLDGAMVLDLEATSLFDLSEAA